MARDIRGNSSPALPEEKRLNSYILQAKELTKVAIESVGDLECKLEYVLHSPEPTAEGKEEPVYDVRSLADLSELVDMLNGLIGMIRSLTRRTVT